jgi:hypothetical protein
MSTSNVSTLASTLSTADLATVCGGSPESLMAQGQNVLGYLDCVKGVNAQSEQFAANQQARMQQVGLGTMSREDWMKASIDEVSTVQKGFGSCAEKYPLGR